MYKSGLLLFTVLFSALLSFAQTGFNLDVASFADSLAKPSAQLLDVRTASEYKSGFIPSALQADWNNKKQFADRSQYIDKSKPIYVYCLSGARSSDAAQWLRKNGWKNVYHLQGGLIAWKKQGRAIEGGEPVQQMSMSVYGELIKSHNTVLVDFGATWCPPCKKMEPVLTELQEQSGNRFKLVKVDGGNDTDVMNAMHVDALPVFIVYKNGKEVWRKQGVVSKEELLKAIAD